MAVEAQGGELLSVVVLLGAGVVAVPLFRRAGLGSVLGYLAAGLAIGPFGLGLFDDPEAILHTAELGVVLFLFVIGLEMQPSRLWSLRREIFGLGVAQVLAGALLLSGVGLLAGLPAVPVVVAAFGFTLSSTAIVMQLLDERGETSTPKGQRVVSILLLEDLAIVPLLALVAFLAPGGETADAATRMVDIAIALASLAALVAAGRWLLDPLFGLLAAAHAREVMTAAALLVVLGAALLMELGGLSMAMGAFLAGVLLSESSFRHQLEADVEPFRGILLGLFFLAVGMSLDLAEVAAAWPLLLAAVALLMGAKGLAVYLVARAFGGGTREAAERAALLAQGGEFAFVLYAAAAAAGILAGDATALLTAAVILSMAVTPFAVLAVRRFWPAEAASLDGVEAARDLHGHVLMIGFGRFAQVAAQALLARGFEVSTIESDPEMIRSAAGFGFKVYYGDGTRLDILRTSGAGEAKAILVCVDDRASADRIVELVKAEFPLARLYVRAWDRGHAIELERTGVDYQVRETFESAMAFGAAALAGLGVPPAELEELMADVRRRDAERLQIQVVAGLEAGRDLMRNNTTPRPTPLTRPQRPGEVLDGATGAATEPPAATGA